MSEDNKKNIAIANIIAATDPSPCKNCTERFLGCWGVCDKYINWKKSIIQKNTEYRKSQYKHSKYNI